MKNQSEQWAQNEIHKLKVQVCILCCTLPAFFAIAFEILNKL
jgi:hypothetical protein